MFRTVCAAVAALVAFAGAAQAQAAYDAEAWVRDLGVVRQAMSTRYANLQWAVEEREADLPTRFAAMERQLRAASSDAEARRVFERFAEVLGDGHVEFRWPIAAAPVAAPAPAASAAAPTPSPCDSIGVRSVSDRGPLAARSPGWRELGAETDAFRTGLIRVRDKTVGVVRIPLFMPTSRPELCAAALQRLNLTPQSPCDDACRRSLNAALVELYTDAFRDALWRVREPRPDAFLIDLTGNGGGSEWAEVAVRMVSPERLRSARLAVIRHPHWIEQLRMRIADVETAWRAAPDSQRPGLRRLRDELRAMQAELARPCDASAIWQDRPLTCSPTVSGPLYATGVSDRNHEWFDGAEWAGNVFDPRQVPYPTGVVPGPLIVAVDGTTASAAEQFAAVLQDNRAAVIVGSPTHGSGCGFVNGGVPTPLPHSGGTLMLPDCARLRADGSNEVAGITPDVLVPFRRFQGLRRRAALLQAALPAAVERATAAR